MTVAERLPDIGKIVLLFVLALMLQAVLTNRLVVLGVTADFFLISTVLIAIGRGSMAGTVFAFFAGLIADVVFLEPIGLRTFIYVVIAYGVGRYGEEFGLHSAWSVVLLTLFAALFAQVTYGLFQLAMGQGSFWSMVPRQMVPAAVVNALVAAPMYLGLVRVGVLRPPGEANPSFK